MDASPVEVSGVVAREVYARGTKSEHDGVVLKGDGGTTYLLRRQDSPGFNDDVLDGLVGKTVTANGLLVGSTLIMRSWRPRE